MKKFFIFYLFAVFAFGQNQYPKDFFRSPLDIPLQLSGNFGELRPNHFHSGFDFKTQKKEVPLIKKSKETKKVTDCMDRDETILRLAFMAAQLDFNALIDTDVKAEKHRNHGHHKHSWSGTGVPAFVNEEILEKQFRQNQIYR